MQMQILGQNFNFFSSTLAPPEIVKKLNFSYLAPPPQKKNPGATVVYAKGLTVRSKNSFTVKPIVYFFGDICIQFIAFSSN